MMQGSQTTGSRAAHLAGSDVGALDQYRTSDSPGSPRRHVTDAPTASWTCRVCGADRSTANALRARLGLRPVRRNTPCCTPACLREYERRRARELYGNESRYRYPMPKNWACVICGRHADEALHRERRERGLRPLSRSYRTCSPECAAKLPHGLHAQRARWCCSECGKPFSVADRERLARGAPPLAAASVTCSRDCEAKRQRRLGSGPHCAECGARLDDKNRAPTAGRKHRVTCSPRCARIRARRITKGLLRIRRSLALVRAPKAGRLEVGRASALPHSAASPGHR
jgi:hypothetical protein